MAGRGPCRSIQSLKARFCFGRALSYRRMREEDAGRHSCEHVGNVGSTLGPPQSPARGVLTLRCVNSAVCYATGGSGRRIELRGGVQLDDLGNVQGAAECGPRAPRLGVVPHHAERLRPHHVAAGLPRGTGASRRSGPACRGHATRVARLLGPRFRPAGAGRHRMAARAGAPSGHRQVHAGLGRPTQGAIRHHRRPHLRCRRSRGNSPSAGRAGSRAGQRAANQRAKKAFTRIRSGFSSPARHSHGWHRSHPGSVRCP
jgi:hypothetical protein